MQAEPELDFPRVLRELIGRGVRFVVIGGQAVILHGIPLFSFDFDLWVDPAAREEVLTWLESDDDNELTAGPRDLAPIVKVYVGHDRLDLFFVRAMTNRDGVTLTFDEVHGRALRVSDPGAGLEAVPIPSIDDLIALKHMAGSPRAKDEEAIRYLRAKKLLEPDQGED